jgi:hypothetical protein
VRAISTKRKSENIERLALMVQKFGPPSTWRCQFDQFRRRHPKVKIQKQDKECWGEVHGHEIFKRSRGGSILDMDNVVLMCVYHNGFIEDFPNTANQLGLAAHSWDENVIRYGDEGPKL